MLTCAKRLFILLCLISYCPRGVYAVDLYSHTAEQLHDEFTSRLNPFRMNNSLDILIEFNGKLHQLNYNVIDGTSKKVICQEDGFEIIFNRLNNAEYSIESAHSTLWKSDFLFLNELLKLTYFISMASDKKSDKCGYFYDPPGIINIRSLRDDFLERLKLALQPNNEEEVRTPLRLGEAHYNYLQGYTLSLLEVCSLYSRSGTKNEWFLSTKAKQYYREVQDYKPALLEENKGHKVLCFTEDRSVRYRNINDDFERSPYKDFDVVMMPDSFMWQVTPINQDVLQRLSDVGHLFLLNMNCRFKNIQLRKDKKQERFVAKLIINSLYHGMDELHHRSPRGVIMITGITAVAELLTHFSADLVEYALQHGLAQIIKNTASAASIAAAAAINMPALVTLALVEGIFTFYEVYESIQNGKKIETLKLIFSIKLYDDNSTLSYLIEDYMHPRTYDFLDYDKEVITSTVIRAIQGGAKYEEIIEATLNQPFIVDLLEKLTSSFNYTFTPMEPQKFY